MIDKSVQVGDQIELADGWPIATIVSINLGGVTTDNPHWSFVPWNKVRRYWHVR